MTSGKRKGWPEGLLACDEPGETEVLGVDIPIEAFRANGPEDDPTAKLNGTLYLGGVHGGGVPHHVEAYAVKPSDGWEPVAAHPDHAEILREMYLLIDGDGPWETTEIGGREYVIIITPHCN